ncbi:MAG: Spy/CpxP family protein refolding chaperone [Acidobacteriota bacterium]
MRRIFIKTYIFALIISAFLSQVSAFGQANNRRILKQEQRQQKIQQRMEGQQRNVPPRFGRPGAKNIPGIKPDVMNPNRPPNLIQRQIKAQLMEALALTPQQRMRIGEINRFHEDEAIAVGRRLRQSRQALDRALMNENFDEGLIKQLTDEVVAAQTAQIRLQSRRGAEIRSVITPEQVRRFRQKEREIRQRIKEQQLLNEQQDAPPVNQPKKPDGSEDLLNNIFLFADGQWDDEFLLEVILK